MQETNAWDDLLGALIEICEPLLRATVAVPIEHVPRGGLENLDSRLSGFSA